MSDLFLDEAGVVAGLDQQGDVAAAQGVEVQSGVGQAGCVTEFGEAVGQCPVRDSFRSFGWKQCGPGGAVEAGVACCGDLGRWTLLK